MDLSHSLPRGTVYSGFEVPDCPLFTEEPVGKQAEFYMSPARIRLALGGNRAGKTSAGAREADFWLTGTHPFRDVPPFACKGWVVCETREMANEVLIPKLLHYLPETGPGALEKYDPGNDTRPASITTRNKSRLIVRTFGQGRARFQSDAVDFIWGDEEMPEAIYNECLLRLVDRNGAMWLTMTPLLGRTYVYEKIYLPWASLEALPEEIEVFQWSIWDNTSLPREAISSIMSKIEDEAERESREHGSFTDRTGLVHKEFDAACHVIDAFPIPPAWPCVLALDPGHRHPFGASLQTETPWGDRIVVGEMHTAGSSASVAAIKLFRLVSQQLPHCVKHRQLETIAALAGRNHAVGLAIRKIPPAFRNLVVVRDPSAASYGEELLQYGIPSRLANRDVMTGLTRISTMLKNAKEGVSPGIYYFRGHTSRHIEEFRTYVWKNADGKEGEVLKKNDNCMDANRYGVMQPLSAGFAAQLNRRTPSRMKAWTQSISGRGATDEWREFDPEGARPHGWAGGEQNIGAWLAEAERRARSARSSLARRGRYSEEDLMNHLEEKFGGPHRVGNHSLRRMRPAW